MYTSVQEVENYLLLEIADEFEEQVDGWIKAMSEQVKLLTNREWLADTEDTERLFDGRGTQYLRIGEAVSIEKVEVGENYGQGFSEVTDFIVSPYDSLPITKIILADDVFPRGIANVRVTGKFGYGEEVPEDIKLATTILVAGIILNQTYPQGDIESEKIGNYAVSYKTEEQKRDYKQAMDIIASRRVILL